MTDVIFRKPDIKALTQGYENVYDMHFHTRCSLDSISSPKLIVRKLMKTGIGVAVTDHNVITGAKEMWRYKDQVKIIPGIEITDAVGIHTIVYFHTYNDLEDFYNTRIKQKLYRVPFFISKNLCYIIENAKDYSCKVCLPHPFSPGSVNIKNFDFTDDILDSIDYIEAINSFNLRARNQQALSYAQVLGKGMTGGSDGHSVGELGGAVTAANGNDLGDFFDEISKGRNIVVGKETNMIKKAVQSIGRESVQIKRNIISHQQINRMRAQFYVNQQNLSSKIGNGKKKIAKIAFWNRKD